MLNISLRNVRLHGKHGLYPQEAITGNEFEVNVSVAVDVTAEEEWPFIDYSNLYAIVTEVFAIPTLLLETLVRDIYLRIKTDLPAHSVVSVSVRKLHPPIEGAVIESAEVSFSD